MTGTLHEDRCTFIYDWILFRIRNISKKYIEKIKTLITYSITFFFFFSRKSCRWWDSVQTFVDPDSPQVKILRMRITCWITKATDTHSKCIILITFSLHSGIGTRLSDTSICTLTAFLYFKIFVSSYQFCYSWVTGNESKFLRMEDACEERCKICSKSTLTRKTAGFYS